MLNETTTPVIDLPVLVGNSIDSLDFGSTRLTTCIKAIERLRRVIEDISMLSSGEEMKSIFDVCQEMELMIEKSRTLIDEMYIGPREALHQMDLFLEAQFKNS